VPLPTNSGNWIAGSWSPALNNLATTTYTFTPSVSPSLNTATMTIEVYPYPTAPTVDATQTFTTLSTFGDLIPAPSETIKWYSNPTGGSPRASTSPISATTYYVAKRNSGGCESERIPVTVVLNLLGTHLNFNGTNNFVDLANIIPAGASYTKEAVVKISNLNGNYNILSSTGEAFWIGSGLLRAGHTNYFSKVTSLDGWFYGTWNHVAVTYDAPTTTMKLYINGNLVSTNTTVPATTGNTIQIGGYNSSTVFRGSIDEIRIWNVVRTQTQINSNRLCELQGNEAGLTAYYKFNQGTGGASNTTVTSLINSVSGGVDGTLQNFSLTGTTSNWMFGSSILTGVVVPNAPTASAQSFCGSKTVADLIPTASATIQWYDVASGGTALENTTDLATGTYYVSESNSNGCESARTSVAVTVNITTAPTAAAQTFTTLKTVADLVPAPSTTIKWYDVATDGTPLSSATALVTGTYYVSATNAGSCESVRTSVAITMNVPATHLHFDGVDDYVILSNENAFDFTNQMTVEFWMNSNASPELWDALVAKGDDSWRIALTNAGKINFAGNGSFGNVTSNTTVVDGGWHHISVTYNGSTAIIYVDGIVDNSIAGTGNINNSSYNVSIGENAQATGRYYTGNLEEVRIWNVARTAYQVNGAKSCELQGNETGLVAYYKFNQGISGASNSTVTSLINSVSGGTNGTLQNFALSDTSSNWMAGSSIVTGVVVPAAPTASAQSFCGSKTVADLTPVETATLKWYNVASGGTALGNATALATGTYYVSESNSNGCESARTAVVVNVNTIPTAPTASAQTFFTGNTVADLVPAPSTTIKWYNIITGGTALASTTALATGTYYVSTTNASGCESTRTSVNVTVIQTFSATHLNFDGINDYVDLGSTANLKPTNAITVEFNAYSSNWSSISNNATLIGNTQSGGWAIGVSGTNLTAVVARNAAYATLTKPLSQISAGWHHFALTYDNQYLKFYMDGNLISTNNAGSAYDIIYNANNSTMIGGESSGNAGVTEAGRYFNGAIDDLRIWNVARTQADFIAFKNCELQGTETGLVAYYNFNQGTTGNNPTQTSLIDATTNANHGTLTNFALTYNVASSNWASGSPITTGTVIQDSPTVISPVIYYQGATAITLNTVSNNSNLWWYTGATAVNGSPFPPTPSTATVGSTSYWVAKKNANGCYSGRTEIVVNVYAPTPGTHLNFDGNNDQVILPNSTDFNFTNQMTVELWMNSNLTPQQWDALVAKGDDSWRVTLTATGKINFAGNGAFGNLTSVATVNDGEWHHIAATYNGSDAIIYIDGVLDKSIAGTGTIAVSTYQVALGANLQITGRTYYGNMDEVRIWNVARTASQIAQSKNCELQGSETGLVAYYKFNQGSAGVNNAGITTLTDATGNGHNGSLTYFGLTNANYSNWFAGSPVSTGVSVPAAPNVLAQTYVLGETVADLVPASSESIAWYSAATGGSPLATDVEVTAGTYYVSAINTNGCESSRTSVAVTEIFAPVAFAVSGGGSTCADGAGVAIELSGSEEGVTYQVQLASTNIGDAVVGTGEALSLGNFVTAGTYTVVATNTETELTTVMTGSASITTLIYPVAIPVPAVACAGTSVALSASVGTLSNFTGAFAPANWTFTNTNADGTLNTTNAPTSVSITGGDSFNSGPGTTDYNITMPVSGTLSFSWAYSTYDGASWDYPQLVYNNATSLFAGYNTGGTPTQSGSVTMEVQAGKTLILRMYTADNSSGAATVVISNFSVVTTTAGTPSYAWTATDGGVLTGATDGLTASATTAGTYILTATVDGCTFSDDVAVTYYDAIVATVAEETVLSSVEGVDGALTVSATGGTSPFTYLWNTEATTASITGLGAGTYTCLVTDANGCSTSVEQVLAYIAPAPVAFAVTGGGSTCADGAGVAIELSDSEEGVTYQVQLASTNVGNAVAGTGEALSLGNFATAGIYTVLATNTELELTTTMTGNAIVSTLNYTVEIEAEAVTCISQTITLTGSIEGSNAPDLSWTASNGGVIDGDTDGLEIEATSSGTYTLTATVDGCMFTKEIVVDFNSFELDITTWNGTAWSNGQPHIGVKAIIDGDLIVSANLEACELVITENGSLTVQSGAYTGVIGKVTNNAAALDFVVENNGVLVQLKNIDNEGPVTVNVNSFPLYRQDYTLWSSPVLNQNLRSFSTQTIFNRFSSYDASLGTVGEYVQEIFTTQDVLTKEFEAANGYLIRMPNNWAEYVDAGTPGVSYEGIFKGVPQNGTITVPLSTANVGMNLVGNPYPSPIIIPAFFGSNPNIEQTIYYWRKRNGATGSGYATYNNMGFVTLQEGLSAIETAIESAPAVNPGQGFFVKSTGATQLNFNNEMRYFQSNGVFLRSATQEKHRFRLNLSSSTALVGQTLIGYVDGASAGVDNGYDSSYFNDSSTALTSLINGTEYIIQGLGLPFDVTSSVPLGFKTDVAGTFSISLGTFDGFFAVDQNIYVKDNLSGQVHNVKESAYSFVTEAGVFNDRFEVVYQNTVLGTDHPDFDGTKVMVYKQDDAIHINTIDAVMQKVALYDVRGSLIQVLEDVNQTTARFSHLNIANQVVLVKITTVDHKVTTKKIVF
jgi:hypothetical protein